MLVEGRFPKSNGIRRGEISEGDYKSWRILQGRWRLELVYKIDRRNRMSLEGKFLPRREMLLIIL